MFQKKLLLIKENKIQFIEVYKGGFHSCVRKTLQCSRWMGLLPLSGLRNPSSQALRFRLLSLYTPLYIISILGQVIMFSLSSCRLLVKGATLTNITNCLFYSSSLLSSIVLANIAKRWSALVADVELIESSLPPFNKNVVKYCNFTTVFILSVAVVEHLLSLYYGLTVARFCDEQRVTISVFFYYMPWIFDFTPYSLWKGLLGEILNIQSTLMWSYSDLLIMVISIYLTEHLLLHSHLLRNALNYENFALVDFRLQYLKIVKLLRLINKTFGIYILISFGSNLFWICIQLFYTLNKNQSGHFVACSLIDTDDGKRTINGLEHTIYFTFSFTFVVVRTLLVLLLSARVHTASLKPLKYLYEIPGDQFNIEVRRYIDQIINMKVALSGMDFFFVTRTMILTLLGTIITYELVLLQFHK